MGKPVVRLTANLDPHTAKQLQDLAEKWETTATAALHRAIATAALMQERIDAGGKVLFQDKDQEQVREISFTAS